jgi:uncharacterized membrane protein YesL
MELFRFDGPIYRLVVWVLRLIAISAIFWVGCIPIVTFPVAWIGALRISRHYVERESGSLWHACFEAIRHTWLRSLAVGWGLSAAAFLIITDMRVIALVHGPGFSPFVALAWALLALLAAYGCHVFPLFLRGRLPVSIALGQALRLTLEKPVVTLALLGGLALGSLLAAYSPAFLILLFPGSAALWTQMLVGRKLGAIVR